MRSANRKNYVINQPQFSRGVADQSVNFIVSLQIRKLEPYFELKIMINFDFDLSSHKLNIYIIPFMLMMILYMLLIHQMKDISKNYVKPDLKIQIR